MKHKSGQPHQIYTNVQNLAIKSNNCRKSQFKIFTLYKKGFKGHVNICLARQ